MKRKIKRKRTKKILVKPEYDVQQKEDKALREYEDARRRIRANLFGNLH